MKKLFLIALALVCAVSCRSYVDRLEDFVSEVEANYSEYNDADWMVMDQKCAEFKSEFAKKYDRLNEYERVYAGEAFDRYDAAVAKGKVNQAVGGAKKFLENAGHYLEGLVEEFAGEGGQQVDSL
jgi:hypothetical protein